jgi:precorrin-6B methylase 2
MFSFITGVIGGRTSKHITDEVRSLRRKMLSDRRVVRVTDLGTGSSVLHGTDRSIRQIASVAALPQRETALLARIASSLDNIIGRVPEDQEVPERLPHNPEKSSPGEKLQPGYQPVILELGTSLGISTLALALGAPHRRVITVEGCPGIAAIARENLRRHGADNVEVLNMEFSQALGYLSERGVKVGMAFIDGNHRGAALTEYTQRILEMGEGMIIVADDIHMNRDMIQAWKSLCPLQLKSRAAMSPSKPPSATGIVVPPSGLPTAMQPSTAAAMPPSGLPTATGVVMPPSGPPSATATTTTRPAPPPAVSPATASLETFRLGLLFRIRHLTPGRYRILY